MKRTVSLLLSFLFACSDTGSAKPKDAGSDATSLIGDSAAKPGECGDETRSVYVVTKENSFYRFDPETANFTLVGLLNCEAGADPTSMAVDRKGFAWVRYSDQRIFRVSVKDASCKATTFAAGQEGIYQFGMGFSTNKTGGGEMLFLADSNGSGLATLDTATLKVAKVGPFDGEFVNKKAELTGTGDGRLFGFFPDFYPARMAEIDKTTGAVSGAKVLDGVEATAEWAFAFYGGDFFAFHSKDSGNGLPQSEAGSTVTRYRPADGSVAKVKQVAFRVVGAGVSTCAPTTSTK